MLWLAPVVAARQPAVFKGVQAGSVTVAAGGLCDFAYRQDYVEHYTITGFFNGSLFAKAHFRQYITHTNLDTGRALTDEPVFNLTSRISIGPGLPPVSTFNGVIWHLRDADGRPVTIEGGQIRSTFAWIDDEWTSSTPSFTPGLTPAFADVICPALGGHPA